MSLANSQQSTEVKPKLSSANEVHVAIVGHTNTGKTSLIRTLLQDARFGEVGNRAGTTRHVEASAVNLGSGKQLFLYDTPGMEDAIALLDTLNSTDMREQSSELILNFLQSPAAQDEFEQEAKVLRQVLKSDLAIYVIDAREPVLGKFKDELQLLSLCGIPVLPLLNFTAQENKEADWREVLAGINLHVVAAFDTVLYNHDHEMELFNQMATLLQAKSALIKTVREYRNQQWLQKCETGKKILATALIDFAAWREKYREHDDAQRLITEYQQIIRDKENQLLKQFLELYQFPESALAQTQLGIENLHWQEDIFDAEVWMHYGLDVSSAVAKGGAVGFTVDLATGGLSLGAGTLIGASAGLLLRKGQEWKEKLQGYKVWQLDESSLKILFARQQLLLAILSSRGHAAIDVISLDEYDFAKAELPKALKKARFKSYWSQLNDNHRPASNSRKQAIESLMQAL